MLNDYYVYEWSHPASGEVFYVGMGRKLRAWDARRRNSRFKDFCSQLEAIGLKPVVVLVAENLSEKEAFNLEGDRVQFHGIDTLTNGHWIIPWGLMIHSKADFKKRSASQKARRMKERRERVDRPIAKPATLC